MQAKEGDVQNKELALEQKITEEFINSLDPLIQQALDCCSVSLVRFFTGNALLITWRNDDHISPILCKGLVEIAQAVQEQYGDTVICLRHYRKNMTMRWNSKQLVKHFKRSSNQM